MISPDNLISLLWAPFLPAIRTGGPVYFCFHREMLDLLFANHDNGQGDSVELISSAARSFLIIDDSDVILSPNALAPNQVGFSASIILICQQILAVEAMVNEESGFSENAYFPRLRKLISASLPELSSNPYLFDDFERVWRRFEQEIRSIQGSSSDSITFRFGVEYGVNKARSFPLSQALLSREDLLVLTAKIGREKLLKAGLENCWDLLRKERTNLRRRARRIIGLPIFRERIVEQICSFAAKVQPDELILSDNTEKIDRESELRIYKESFDWLSEEFHAYLYSLDGEAIRDESITSGALIRALDQNGFLVLPLGDFGDFWVKNNKATIVSLNEPMLLIGSETGLAKVQALISRLIGRPASILQKKTLYNSQGLWVYEALLPKEFTGTFMVQSGKLLAPQTALAQVYEWIGGVCVDIRSDKYLKDFLPHSVKAGERLIPIENMISVNERSMPYLSFVEMVKNLDADETFELYFRGNIWAKLSVGICRIEAPERMGYVFDDAGFVLPELVSVESNELSIIGFTPPSIAENIWSQAKCARLLSALIRNLGQTLSEEERAGFHSSVVASRIPTEVKIVIRKLLAGGAKIPSEVIEQLRNRDFM